MPGRWWHDTGDGRIQCDLCPRACRMSDGQRGFCFVRANAGERMVLTSWGRASGFCVDPIEKKPLAHFHPGTAVLSFGTAGCNLGCRFCQNWEISKARESDRLHQEALPESIAQAAIEQGCASVAFTYNDPVIFAEYAIDTAAACRARGVNTVAVTAGYITAEARPEFFAAIDAANVDLKAFTEDFYRRLCLGHLEPIKETLRYLARETGVWLEVTTLLIPGENDSEAEVARLCEWFVGELGSNVPLHFTAFHPDFRMLDLPATPPGTLRRARQQARAAGIHHVYIGNVRDSEGEATICSGCGRRVIERNGYRIERYHLDAGGACLFCSKVLAGRFSAAPGQWGGRRLPIHIG